jgi:hypothetical protein
LSRVAVVAVALVVVVVPVVIVRPCLENLLEAVQVQKLQYHYRRPQTTR